MISQTIRSCEADMPPERAFAEGSSEDEQITVALEDYVSLRRAGRTPEREEFLARYRSIASALADCLDGLEFVEGAADHFAARGPEVEPGIATSPPAQLGEYRLIRQIGQGGMGVVYEAEQVPLGRRVALKVLPTAATLDPRQRERFQVEAQAAALLHHEHIVPIFAIGSDAGVAYYAMQLIDGLSMTDVIRWLRAAKSRSAGGRPGRNRPAQPSLASCESPPSRRAWLTAACGRGHCRTAAQWASRPRLRLNMRMRLV